MLRFQETSDPNVLKVLNKHGSSLGEIIRQEPCGGHLFMSERPLCEPEIRQIADKMSELGGPCGIRD